METSPSTTRATDHLLEPVELTAAELTMVSGGLNPQPLPPIVDPDRRM
jgi:hypothetical protein